MSPCPQSSTTQHQETPPWPVISLRKKNLNKFNKNEIIAIFSPHSGMKLEINNRRKAVQFTNMSKLYNTFKQQMGHRRNQKGDTKYPKTNENINTTYQN